MARGIKPSQLGYPLAMKNKIINGCMRVPQRGTSLTIGQLAASYTLDRWDLYNQHDAGNITVTQDSTVPNNNFQYSLKVTNAAGNDTSIAAGQYCAFQQIVEGYNIVSLRSGRIALSFWVRSSKTGTYCVAFRNCNDRSFVAEYTINSANTWEFKTITVDLSAGVASGTWLYTNGRGLSVDFSLAIGSTYYTTPNSWQNVNCLASSNQVNWLNEQNNTFYLTGVQLEAGGASVFEVRDIGKEIMLCQRYYCKTYDLGTIVGTVTYVGGMEMGYLPGGLLGYAFGIDWRFPVCMRAIPVVTAYSPVTGASGKANVGGGGGDYNCSSAGIGVQGAGLETGGGATAGWGYVQAGADAEL